MTNKGERQRKTKLKFLKRLKKWQLYDKFKNNEGNFFMFKTTGSPCSCPICSGKKYSRKNKHKGINLND